MTTSRAREATVASRMPLPGPDKLTLPYFAPKPNQKKLTVSAGDHTLYPNHYP